MSNNNTRADQISAHRERLDQRILDRVDAAMMRDIEAGAFANLEGAAWPELRRALHVRIRRVLLDAGLGGGERGVARVDRAVASAIDAFEKSRRLR